MATVVTICNLALSRIGDSATISSISPPDGSAQAEACSRLYPVALSTCLDLFNWSFATRRKAPAELADTMVEKGMWQHAYGLPADCKRVIDIKPTEQTKIHFMHHFAFHHKIEFEVVGTDTGLVLLTNLEAPLVRYVCAEPKPSQFSGMFTDALAWLLAAYLAGETIRGDSAFAYTQQCQKQFQATIATAMELDARLTNVKPKHIPHWIEGR